MTDLEKLRAARTLKDVAHVLRVKPKTVSYLLYKLPETEKYHSFEIPKSNGGKRLINAPEQRLKMLQGRLAKILYRCIAEVEKIDPPHHPLAHGFARSCSIFTNASMHKRRRYVLNLDLQDFFPSFNFGRVRGFFIKDKRFGLAEKVATVIAQIACFKNELPQGSPCSPIISNLLGHLLDIRLARLAKKNKCTYSRYADDITFSTSRKDFPTALAKPIPEKPSVWELGSRLVREIHRAGFKINASKTRMQFRGSRQVTTGLIVNEKVNIRSEYYRNARAICHQLFSTGSYYISDPESPVKGLNKIEGMLSHIHYIKDHPGPKAKAKAKKQKMPTTAQTETLAAAQKLYKKFLFYKHFVALEKPLIVTEGKTDVIYLRAAIMKQTNYHPQLGEFINGSFSSAVRFMRYSPTICQVLQLCGGTGDLSRLTAKYKDAIASFKYAPLAHPVIILIDNDDGAKSIFSAVKENYGLKITNKSSELCYHLHKNLYLVKTPEDDTDSQSCIEDLFDSNWLETPVDGKTFDHSKKHKSDETYGKIIFAQKVIRPNTDKIDFSRFGELLKRIVAVLDDYEKRKSSSAGS